MKQRCQVTELKFQGFVKLSKAITEIRFLILGTSKAISTKRNYQLIYNTLNKISFPVKKLYVLNWTSRAKRHFRLFKFPLLNFKTNMTSIDWAPFLLISNSSTFLSMGRFFNCFKICFKFSNRSIPRLSCFSSSSNNPSAFWIVPSLPTEISFLHIKTNLSNWFTSIFVLIWNRTSLYSISDIFSI